MKSERQWRPSCTLLKPQKPFRNLAIFLNIFFSDDLPFIFFFLQCRLHPVLHPLKISSVSFLLLHQYPRDVISEEHNDPQEN